MRKKLLVSYLSLILVIIIPLSLVINDVLRENLIVHYQDQLHREILLVERLFKAKWKSATDFQAFTDDIKSMATVRVTVIDGEGKVLADSDEDISKMDNHSNREEVIKAEETGEIASSLRYSNTLKTDYLYTAKTVTVNDHLYIIRISKPLFELKQFNAAIQRYTMLTLIVAMVIAMIMAIFLSRRMTRPIDEITEAAKDIAKGNYGRKIYTFSNDQIGELTESFNSMSYNLANTMAQIKHRNGELESILNSMINGVIAIDHHKNILMINPICFKILGLPDNYVAQNESMYKIIRNEEIAELVEKTISEGISQIKEMPYVHLDKILRIYINPILTSEKEKIGCIVVIQDVTQMRKLEQMRSDFVSNVSHELKTPLTSIKGFVDTLRNGAIKDEEIAIRFLEIIDIESDRLYRLINDILVLSEIESMDKEREQECVQLEPLTEEVISMLSLKAEQKGLLLESHCDEGAEILGNSDRIKQLLINLVDNAIKYTEKGQIKLAIEEINHHVRISVSDTGIGISEEHLDRLFERFYRVDKGRSRNQGGTGLGLSIVKHIAILYNGVIDVKSQPGVGSQFTLTFPMKRK